MTRARSIDGSSRLEWWTDPQAPAPLSTASPYLSSLVDRVEPANARQPRGLPSGAPVPPAKTDLSHDVRARFQALTQSDGASVRASRADRPISVYGKKFRRGQGDRLWLHLAAQGRSYKKWARNHPVEARQIGRPRDVPKMIRSIRRNFTRMHSPLAKHAARFVVAGYLSGYDPRFIAAFAALESGWGRYTPSNAPYNYWGWSVYTGRQHSLVTKPFQQPGTAFRFFGRSLRRNYGGAQSVHSHIWDRYAADPNHERNIASILRSTFGGNPNNIRFPHRLLDR